MQFVHDARLALVQTETEFVASMASPAIWDFEQARPGVDVETAKRVSRAYESKLVSKKGDARPFYDALRIAAKDGKCPNCMARDASALDHYLPREKYPAMAMQPTNLAPICTGCNTIKRQDVASAAEDQFLHPYFDKLGSEPWLSADVQELPSSPLTFSTLRPDAWDDVLFARVEGHFSRYKLGKLFATHSSSLLGNLRVLFQEEYVTGGPTAVARMATRLQNSYNRPGLSPWAVAAFKAWSTSDWFCNGGWRA